MYICMQCNNEMKSLEEKFVRCSYCGCRILFKKRPPLAKEVSTD
ncbi:DNA-directed RNA polymerase subunit P [Candidatus Micrarchaeota archaeon CG08_land_8_20_14_0_20_49_17]|nr:MAG: DNA-directed RNA polymerase subunit P [Candidatus Micrarchaeota archaeon CG08_land_8_20_14_0_20_49_17]PIU81632.1 MAG: DNA-directed RNA polymerase subunit P [Candidatus Micrarchaeota archaeon CG06_land_8_20_14_3_00_50_6]PIZ94171.1 MAG: DNA-directed RNA polymerase subunit P [Candidatus Micrarchaeota archaeon CG_4_10_14_0_2_um_filter_49_7]HII53686.1 DNA-directed RNA polymerase subunit P [Candidatus Micrarchaeota archaeon]